jgi:transcriptional regulator with XRE-family HTH domain
VAMNTSTPLYEFVIAHLRAKAIPQRTVAAGSGVPYSTVTKIAQGSVKDPGVHTVQRLADFFAKQAQRPQQIQPEPVEEAA